MEELEQTPPLPTEENPDGSEFFEQWEAPSFEEFCQIVEEGKWDFSKTVSPDLTQSYELSKLFSFIIMDEEVPENLKIKADPELLEMLQELVAEGDPIERGLLTSIILQQERYIKNLRQSHGDGLVREYIKKQVQDKGKTTGLGRGGESHDGDWFGGMAQPPAVKYLGADAKERILAAMNALKKHASFNLSNRQKSNETRTALFGEFTRLSYAEFPDDPASILLDTMLIPELFELAMLERRVPFWEPREKVPQRRRWVVMIDDSGSMNTQDKQIWVLALLYIIGEDVLKGESEAFIFPYEWHLGPCFHVHDKDSLNAYLRAYRGGHGGDTDIEGCLTKLAKHMDEGEFRTVSDNIAVEMTNMEIFLICDGQDPVDHGFKPARKVHSISLFNKNAGIDGAVIRSGGHAFWIEKDGRLTVSDGRTDESEFDDDDDW